MLEFWAAQGYVLGDSIQSARAALASNAGVLSFEERDQVIDLLERVQSATSRLGMKAAMDLAGTLQIDVKYDDELSAQAVYHHLDALNRAIRSGLDGKGFVYIPDDLALLYSSPTDAWDNVPTQFPSTLKDLTCGVQCLALGQPTASIFHLMRVLEKGLRALATDLGVPQAKQDVSTWGDMLNDIKAASDARVSAMPKGPARIAEAQYYGGLVQDFRHFKDAWRDRVSHSERFYDLDEARAVLNHVRSFMVENAKRLHE